MKSKFARAVRRCSLVVVACALWSGVAAAQGVNLLRNGGFEEPLAGHAWMPTAWDTSRSGQPSVFFGRDSLAPHGGAWSVNVANVSTRVPMAYNWSQTIVVGPEAWGKDAVLTVWTRSNGVEGRAYALLQAYRDTVAKMSLEWGVDRDEALRRLRMNRSQDPVLDLGWKRQQFSESETQWVRRDLRVYVPPSVNVLYVRVGLLGAGQLMIDDASLTLEQAAMPPATPPKTNLLADAGFEGDGNAWEYSMPPFEGLRVERDTTVAHTGKTSVVLEGHTGILQARAGVCQVFSNRNLAGKRLRVSGWVKTDSLRTSAFLKAYCHGMYPEAIAIPGWEQFSLNTPWTKTSFEFDVPPDTYSVWVWFLYLTPAKGRAYYDDLSVEVLGPATGVIGPAPSGSGH